jgi:Leucine-rich repeat (LRR) protein
MQEPIPLRCPFCKAHFKAGPSESKVTCTYCGELIDITGLPLFSPADLDYEWFEQQTRIQLTDDQKIGVTWLKKTGRAESINGFGDWLDLTDSEISDADMAYIGTMTFLRELNLGGNSITDLGLLEIIGLHKLTELSLTNCRITNDGVKVIGKMKELQDLDLEGTEVDDTGIESLLGLTCLSEINLRGTMVTEKSICKLAKLPRIEEIRITPEFLNLYPLLKADVLPLINPVKTLCNLSGLGITDDDLVHLKGLEGLVELNLSNNQITGTGLIHLPAPEYFGHLNLSQNPISEEGLKVLKQMRHIKFLKLWKIPITKKQFKKSGLKRPGLSIDFSSTVE